MYAPERNTALATCRQRIQEAERIAANAPQVCIRQFCSEVAEHWRDLAHRMEHEASNRRTWQVVRGLAHAGARDTFDKLEVW